MSPWAYSTGMMSHFDTEHNRPIHVACYMRVSAMGFIQSMIDST